LMIAELQAMIRTRIVHSGAACGDPAN